MSRRARLVLLTVAAAVVLASVLAVFEIQQRRASFDPESLVRYYSAIRAQPAQPVAPAAVMVGISGATDYLRRASLPSGQFIYQVNMNPSVRVAHGYSLLRHAGTVYSLGMAHAVLPDDATVQVMQRAIAFMRECCLSRLDEIRAFGIWEPEALVGWAGPPTYKLGAAGLGLQAMVSVESIRPGSVNMDEMLGLASLGQFLMHRSGEFHGTYVPSEGGKKPLEVLFYPGEMALGWLSFYELQPRPELIEATIKAIGFLARERASEGNAPPDHWALLATAKLFSVAEREKIAIPREALINHAVQVCHEIIDHGYSPPVLPELAGALVPLGEVTSTATRLEGLLAALTFLPAEHPIRPHVEAAVHRGIDFLLRAQVKEGEFAGGMPYALMVLPDDGSQAAANFKVQATEIRIDYVQHALSALIQYLWWISGADAAKRSER